MVAVLGSCDTARRNEYPFTRRTRVELHGKNLVPGPFGKRTGMWRSNIGFGGQKQIDITWRLLQV